MYVKRNRRKMRAARGEKIEFSKMRMVVVDLDCLASIPKILT